MKDPRSVSPFTRGPLLKSGSEIRARASPFEEPACPSAAPHVSGPPLMNKSVAASNLPLINMPSATANAGAVVPIAWDSRSSVGQAPTLVASPMRIAVTTQCIKRSGSASSLARHSGQLDVHGGRNSQASQMSQALGSSSRSSSSSRARDDIAQWRQVGQWEPPRHPDCRLSSIETQIHSQVLKPIRQASPEANTLLLPGAEEELQDGGVQDDKLQCSESWGKTEVVQMQSEPFVNLQQPLQQSVYSSLYHSVSPWREPSQTRTQSQWQWQNPWSTEQQYASHVQQKRLFQHHNTSHSSQDLQQPRMAGCSGSPVDQCQHPRQQQQQEQQALAQTLLQEAHMESSQQVPQHRQQQRPQSLRPQSGSVAQMADLAALALQPSQSPELLASKAEELQKILSKIAQVSRAQHNSEMRLQEEKRELATDHAECKALLSVLSDQKRSAEAHTEKLSSQLHQERRRYKCEQDVWDETRLKYERFEYQMCEREAELCTSLQNAERCEVLQEAKVCELTEQLCELREREQEQLSREVQARTQGDSSAGRCEAMNARRCLFDSPFSMDLSVVHPTSPTVADVSAQHGSNACGFQQKGLESIGLLQELDLRADRGVASNEDQVLSETVDLLRVQASHMSSVTDKQIIHTSSLTANTCWPQTQDNRTSAYQQIDLDVGKAQAAQQMAWASAESDTSTNIVAAQSLPIHAKDCNKDVTCNENFEVSSWHGGVAAGERPSYTSEVNKVEYRARTPIRSSAPAADTPTRGSVAAKISAFERRLQSSTSNSSTPLQEVPKSSRRTLGT